MKKYNSPFKLSDKLKTYSTLTAVAIGSSANAAIQYTDVNPDSTFSTNGDFYGLDLNNDNIIDFRIDLTKIQGVTTYNSYYAYSVDITPQGSNAVSVSTNSYYPYALNSNQTVGPSGSFLSSADMILGRKANLVYGTNSYPDSDGNFLGQANKFIGLRIQVGLNIMDGLG